MIPVIIPFYQRPDQLERCIQHLQAQTEPVHIHVRDNNQENIYFTRAINEGILAYLDQDCDYMIILNQDMYLAPNAVEEMLRFMDAHPDCGIGMPLEILMQHPQGHALIGCQGAFPLGSHASGPPEAYSCDEQLIWANGCCWILRKAMIREIGLLDKHLRLINSDSDYCLRARAHNWTVWRIGAARGSHEQGISTQRSALDLELIKADDTLYFAKKWLTGNLYRELASDGAKWSPQAVQQTVHQFTAGRHAIVEMIAKAKATQAGTLTEETT